MGRLNHGQGQLFYPFCLADAIPDDHTVRDRCGVTPVSLPRLD
jgi:hypothetical protein